MTTTTPIRTLELPVERTEQPPLRLHQAWIDGHDQTDNIEFSMTCGAGVGSPMIQLTVKVDGQTFYEEVHMGDAVEAWVTSIVEEARS